MHTSTKMVSMFVAVSTIAAGLTACEHARASVSDSAVVSNESLNLTEDRVAQGNPGDFCETDEDCSWDDWCFPTRCIDASTEGIEQECEESAPPDGTCGCVDNWCTLRPDEPATRTSTEGGCTQDADCTVDVGSGMCHVGSAHLSPLTELGPLCICNSETTLCEFMWIEPVPCTTFADCWYEREPRLHPVPATEPRDAPVEPCVEGEIDSICDERTRTCRIVAWEC